MASDFQSIRNDLRDLEQRVLNVHAKFNGQTEWQPLEAIAATIRSFAEMLPVYACFVEMMEAVRAGDQSPLT